MTPRLIKDSSGLKSWTHTLCVSAYVVLLVRFATAGITYAGLTTAPMDPIGFATAFTAIIGPILARAWLKKGDSNGGSDTQPSV